jgi:Holliday junction resolvasome RuvABC endonuclease subunit
MQELDRPVSIRRRDMPPLNLTERPEGRLLSWVLIIMGKNKSRILAIDPGIRHMGIALVENGNLIYHEVKSISKQRLPHDTLREGRRIVLRLIEDFRPDVLVYEKAFFAKNRKVALLNVFADEIQAIGKRKKLQVLSYAPRTMKKLVCGSGKASKREVASVVISRYPELKVYLPQVRKWKERYWCNVFDAVALAMVASDVLKTNRSRRNC